MKKNDMFANHSRHAAASIRAAFTVVGSQA